MIWKKATRHINTKMDFYTNTIKVPFLHFPSIPITAELERSFDVFTTHEENEGDFFVC